MPQLIVNLVRNDRVSNLLLSLKDAEKIQSL